MSEKKSSFKVFMVALCAIMAVIGGVSFLIYHFAKEKAYNEKWKDYIDCGL